MERDRERDRERVREREREVRCMNGVNCFPSPGQKQ